MSLLTSLINLRILDEPRFERHINKECESWADWSKLDEREQEDTKEGYYVMGVMVLERVAEKLTQLGSDDDLVSAKMKLLENENARLREIFNENSRMLAAAQNKIKEFEGGI